MGSSFDVIAQSFVPGITAQVFPAGKDGSRSIEVRRVNHAEPEELNQQITSVSLVPAEAIRPNSHSSRKIVAIPDDCEKVFVYVGIGMTTTDESYQFLALEIKSAPDSEGKVTFREPFKIGEL